MNKKGFTLVELLAVIAILALLIIITAFTTLKLLNRTKVESEDIKVKRYLNKVDDSLILAKSKGSHLEDGIYYLNSNELGRKFPYEVLSSFQPEGMYDYVIIKDNKVFKYNITSKQYLLTDLGNYESSNVNDWINVRDFGAIGDGITDDTKAIKEAVNEVNKKGGTLYFPYGTYLVTPEKYQDTILKINSDKKIVVEMDSSTIKLKENNYPHYNIFMISKSTDVILKNGNLIGDRIKHDYTGYIDKSPTHEFGYGIYVYYSKNVVISNMNVSQMTGDAIINKTGTSSGNTNYTLIENSELSYSRRQGLSVLDTDKIEVKNVYIHHIGSFDGVNGTAPKSGIDIEPASGTKIVNSIILDKIRIENTDYFGIINGNDSPTNEFIIKNSEINGPNIRNAKIFNSTLNYINRMSSVLTRCEINDSRINHYAKGVDLFLTNTKIDNSIIEGLNETKGNRLYIQSGSVINDSSILNFLGKTGERALTKVNAGIVNESREVFNNNLYDNVVFIDSVSVGNDYTFSDKNATFKDSFIGVYGNQNVIFNDINFDNITFRTNLYNKGYNRTMYFNNCLIKDSTIKDDGKVIKQYNNTELIKNGEYVEKLD